MGTSRDVSWECNGLGWLVLHTIRERGIVIYGEEVVGEIPAASHENLLADCRAACESMRKHGHPDALHSIDWLLTAARLILWVREGRLSSKSEAAEWGYANAKGGWREQLLQARNLRLNPIMSELPEMRQWLDTLTQPIEKACAELADEIALT